jgi:hypothetical protein
VIGWSKQANNRIRSALLILIIPLINQTQNPNQRDLVIIKTKGYYFQPQTHKETFVCALKINISILSSYICHQFLNQRDPHNIWIGPILPTIVTMRQIPYFWSIFFTIYLHVTLELLEKVTYHTQGNLLLVNFLIMQINNTGQGRR